MGTRCRLLPSSPRTTAVTMPSPASTARTRASSSSPRLRALSMPHWTFALANNEDENTDSPRSVVLSRGRSATIANSLAQGLEVHGLLSAAEASEDEQEESSAENSSTDLYRVCCCKMSGNAVSLLTMAVSFGLITAVQFVFATIANSLALQADCMSMGIDTLTYLASLAVECMPATAPLQKQKMEFAMAGISYFVLLALTLMFIYDGVLMVQTASEEGEGGGVDGKIVIAFATAGIIFDVGSLIVWKCVAHESADEKDSDDSSAKSCGINANVCAALAHVLSDTLRSTTTFIEGMILLTQDDINSTEADGVATLIVCSIIAVGTIGAIFTWLREVRMLLRGDEIQANDVEFDAPVGIELAEQNTKSDI